MRIVTCEDDAVHRQRLRKVMMSYIFSREHMEVVLNASNPQEVLDYIQGQKADCFLLDIELNNVLTGLDIAKEIRRKNPLASIIFITSHADKLKLTFTYQIAALDFIVKNADDFEEEVHRALQAADAHYGRIYTPDEQKSFLLKVGEYIKRIPYDDIYFFQTSPSPHKIELKEKNGVHTFYDKLSNIEGNVDDRFIRCHRGYIVNLQQIQEIDKKARKVMLKNGLTVPFSFTYQGTLQRRFHAN